MKLPAELQVEPEVYTAFDIAICGRVPTYSKLFRANADLETVLDMTLATHPEGEPLTVVSVGCSFGTEAYSVLAYLSKAAPEIGKVSLTGVDINPLAIDAAIDGRYYNEQHFSSHDQKRKAIEALSDFGFDVSPHPERAYKYLIDAAPLRQAHDVSFRVEDVRDSDADLPTADVMLCNNVLWHLSPEDAERMTINMANHLAAGGILSLGTNAIQRRMFYDHDGDGIDYPVWRRDMSEKLATIGVEPILYERERRAPYVFRNEN